MNGQTKTSGIEKATKRSTVVKTEINLGVKHETEIICQEDVVPIVFATTRRDGVINPQSSMDPPTQQQKPTSRQETPECQPTRKSVSFAIKVEGQESSIVPNIFIEYQEFGNTHTTDFFCDSLPENVREREQKQESKRQTIRLIVRRAYRNQLTAQLYAFAEGRRLIIVPTDITAHSLREECLKVLKKDEILELLLSEHGVVTTINETKTLCNLDEIVAVCPSPEPGYSLPCCMSLVKVLNLGHPDHKPLIEDEDDKKIHGLAVRQRSLSRLAIIVQKLNTTATVLDKGSQEVRRMSQGWAKVSGKLLNNSRPFFVYPWHQAFLVDVTVLMWMILYPLAIGVILASLPFDTDTEGNKSVDHRLYAYVGMGILGLQTGFFVNAWIGYYFYVHMSFISYFMNCCLAPFMAIGLYFGVNAIYYPFYNSPVTVMLILTTFVYLMAYPHMPYQLKRKSEVKKDIGNSLMTLDFFMLVFVVNRLLVLNFGQRDATSLIVLSIIYPLLVNRSKTDCSRLAEAFNRKSVAVVEAFFTFVSSVFQMIVFLSIKSKTNPLLVFFLINSVDVGCLILTGPFITFCQATNIKILKQHKDNVDTNPFDEGLSTFAKWVKDPFLLKPFLIKCYCEISAKIIFTLITLLIRYGPARKAYPFIDEVDDGMFTQVMIFTLCELIMWALIQYLVEVYLRYQRCQYMLQKEKKNMLSIAKILGMTNAFITALLLLQQTPVSGA